MSLACFSLQHQTRALLLTHVVFHLTFYNTEYIGTSLRCQSENKKKRATSAAELKYNAIFIAYKLFKYHHLSM